ncbi:MAG TPA: ATP-binding protein [Microbacterium sp.]|nr:ATP-binding protein [Microbacterium sp.]
MRDVGLTNARITAAGWAVGLVVTGLVLWSPVVAFGYRNPSLHLVLDSVDACVALLVAYLVYGRFTRDGRLQDLLLSVGLVLLALAGLVLSYASQALSGTDAGTFDIWLPISVRVIGGLLIASAALAGDVPARRFLPTRPAATVSTVVIIGLLVVAFSLWSMREHLPLALDPAYVPTSTDPPFTAAHPLLIAGQAIAAVSFLIASIAFTVQATRRDDELLRWLGPACALGGFARLNYALFPSQYTDWLYTGDFLRTGCYLLLLIGATREMQSYWGAQARAAVLDDRRRLARELHDGVVQELGYIRSESHALPKETSAGPHIIAACDRALDEARAAVHALGRAGEEPLGFMLHRAARELTERYRINLEVDLDDSIDADAEQKHALVRITREAVSNAVRHGKAERVWVRLTREGSDRCLTIQDDGSGFDVPATVAAGGGYGLTSMRDRARGLPGLLTLQAESDAGSVVTVTW